MSGSSIVVLVLILSAASFGFRSAEGLSAGGGQSESDGGTLIAEIAGPAGWSKMFAVGYHDDHNMLYVSQGGSGSSNKVAYGSYSGGTTVTWTVFDNVDFLSGLGCYQDDVLYGVTQSNPLAPVPYYLYTWQLDSSGIPMLPPDVYQLGAPFATGGFGGCEWDGDYLWILDQNFFVTDDPSIVYKYDVSTHSVVDSWSCSEVGGFGVACVWDAGNLRVWISDWSGGNKLIEHTDTGTTGISYTITASPNDIAYKYGLGLDGPGFFVGNYNANNLHFYDHYLTSLARSTWGCIKATFDE